MFELWKCVQNGGLPTVQQAVLGAEYKGIDEFGLKSRAIFHPGQLQHRKLVGKFNEAESSLTNTIGDSVGEPFFLGCKIRAGRIGAAAFVAARIEGVEHGIVGKAQLGFPVEADTDRKSTRLNSSH